MEGDSFLPALALDCSTLISQVVKLMLKEDKVCVQYKSIITELFPRCLAFTLTHKAAIGTLDDDPFTTYCFMRITYGYVLFAR